jgi:choline dehydrogenase
MYSLLLFSLLVFVPSYNARRTPTPSYDYVVVGCGTAGSVLTARLSGYGTKACATCKPRPVTILCIEDGQEPTGDDRDIHRFFDTYTEIVFYNNFYTYDVNQLAKHQFSSDNPSKDCIRPQVPGGGSRINGDAFQRPSIDDMRAFQSPLWTFDAVNDDWKYIERYNGTPGLPWHGYHGHVVTNQFPPDEYLALMQSAMEVAFNLPYNPDSSSGIAGGVSKLGRNLAVDPHNVTNAFRQDAFTRFLRPLLDGSRHIKFEQGATALKLLLGDDGQHTIIYNQNGLEYRAKAKKELILSAGTYDSAHILLNSGIGNCTELAGVRIPCVLSKPQVGKNFDEGSIVVLEFLGPAATNLGDTRGCIIGAHYAGPSQPVPPYPDGNINIEVLTTSFPLPTLPPTDHVYLWTLDQHKFRSKGTLTLKENNPLSNPIVQSNIFSNPLDIGDSIDGFRKIRNTAALVGFLVEIYPGYVAVPLNATDAEIGAWILSTVGLEHHPTGTNRMHEVVDERGRVTNGLRVADNSIAFPLATHGTAAQAMTIGAVIARLIAEDWGLLPL